MKYLITGSREITDVKAVERILSQHLATKDVVIHGACKTGVDAIANDYAIRYFNDVWAFPADWETHGKAAGPIRNKAMIQEGDPDAVIAIWDGKSRGTKNTIDFALAAKIETHVHFL